MTSEQIEAAVAEYLASGEPQAVAGRTFEPLLCPVARACRFQWHHRYEVLATGIYAVRKCGECATPTATTRRFIAAVDSEPTRLVTFGRCRELFDQAKDKENPSTCPAVKAG